MQYIEFLLQHWVLSGSFIVVVILLIYLEMQGKIGGAKRVSSTVAIQLINKENAKIIDIREKGAYNNGHIVNAIYATKDEIMAGAEKLKKFQDTPIILVCAQGTHAGNIAAQLIKQGFTQVSFLQGGINAWKAEGLPLVKD